MENIIYKCVSCSFQIKDPIRLQKQLCQKCPDPSKKFNYLCPTCQFPLLQYKCK